MKYAAFLGLVAGLALLGAPAANAYNLCMSSPLATFEGAGVMSPDGRFVTAGKRLISVAEMREIGSVPGYGSFSADSSRYFQTQNSGGAGTLDIVDIGTPGAPSHRLNFAAQDYPQISPNGSLLLVSANGT